MNKQIYEEKNPTVLISLETLSKEVKKFPSTWQPLLSDADIFPTDKMDIDPVLALTDNQVTSLLETHSDPALVALGKYLFNLRRYYDHCGVLRVLANIWR